MTNSIASLLGSAGAVLAVVLLVVVVVVGFFMPLLVWSMARNLKGIRRELARMNDNAESVAPAKRTGTFGM